MMKIKAVDDRSETIAPTLTTMEFPGGERHVRVDPDADPTATQVIRFTHASADDILQAIMALNIRDAQFPDMEVIVLAPYWPALRADKDKTQAMAVYGELMRQLASRTKVITCDPHVPIDPLLDGESPIVFTAADLIDRIGLSGYEVIVAPDEGARIRAGEVAEAMNCDLVVAVKHRDPDTGRILSYEAPQIDGKALVVDDICDGGATFSLLADSLNGSADLWITHPVFSGPKERLGRNLSKYRTIHTTDSLPTWIRAVETSPVTCHRIDPMLLDADGIGNNRKEI